MRTTLFVISIITGCLSVLYLTLRLIDRYDEKKKKEAEEAKTVRVVKARKRISIS